MKKKAGRAGARIWTVCHGEVHYRGRAWFVDEAVVFAASSRTAAVRLIRRVRVDPGTWWRIESLRLDDPGGVDRSFLYSRSGRVLRTAPVKEALRRRSATSPP